LARKSLVLPLSAIISLNSIRLVYGHFLVKNAVALGRAEWHLSGMGGKLALAALALLASRADSHALAPLYDPVVLNVGISCQWQRSCERRQLKAMSSARKFIARTHPPLWRIQLCNRNAWRGAARVDWIGFNNCIRNKRLRPSARSR
jgi:hypothetical protein